MGDPLALATLYVVVALWRPPESSSDGLIGGGDIAPGYSLEQKKTFWFHSQEVPLAYSPKLDRKPNTILQKEWLTTIAETGQPELIPALNHGRIPKNTKYEILARVHINRKKRPNRDKAPCPMCTKNRFLRGSLV
jgi:hypothetical protein